MKALRNLTIVSTIVLSVLAVASNAGATFIVDEISGVFGIIGLEPSGFGLSGGSISQSAQDDIAGLGLVNIAVDVTGWTTNGDDVAVVGGTVTIINAGNITTAVFDVTSASLTQILVSPVGVGLMELDLSWLNSDLTYLGQTVDLPSAMQMVISYNGLVVDNGTARLNATTASASFSAIPEPASLAMLLAGFVFLRKRRK
jgi:hypothetical protein